MNQNTCYQIPQIAQENGSQIAWIDLDRKVKKPDGVTGRMDCLLTKSLGITM